MNAARANKPASGGKTYGKSSRLIKRCYDGMDRMEYQLRQLEFEYDTWRREWQYAALCAVETALFAGDMEP
jgi:hypothetical protein